MSFSYLDFEIDDLENALLDLGIKFSKEHYLSKVIKEENGNVLYVAQNRVFKNVIGNPTLVQVRYFTENNKSAIEVKLGKAKIDFDFVTREILGIVLVLPTVVKGIQTLILENKVRDYSLKVAHKHKKTGVKI
ncbi:MAG: hypothetical protein LBM99_04130 [Bacillales bacterium]|jgi:hypothetical protein|nr:hypothetical protein [Bacillales bacterium]